MGHREIGGYFELELTPHESAFPFAKEICVNSGSHAFRLILREKKPRKVWLPDYTCDIMLKAAEAEATEVGLYNVNERLEAAAIPDFDPETELLVINNYFGVKDSYVRKIVTEHPRGIVADCAQALFCTLPENIPVIRSPRKFVGVPDGGTVNLPSISSELPAGSSRYRCESLLARLEAPASAGYEAFKKASAAIHSEDITSMSPLTRKLLASIDFKRVAAKRRANYAILDKSLSSRNLLSPHIDTDPEMPMVYPYMTTDTELRKRLIDNKIYVARYWPSPAEGFPEGSIADKLADMTVPLPIDQRYGAEDMKRILEIIG